MTTAKYVTTRSGQPVEFIARPCDDCGTEVQPDTPRGSNDWQWYMVRDALWTAAGAGDGYLCIPCLETRLGRELTGADFTDCPANRPGFYEDTPRLAALKAEAARLGPDE